MAKTATSSGAPQTAEGKSAPENSASGNSAPENSASGKLASGNSALDNSASLVKGAGIETAAKARDTDGKLPGGGADAPQTGNNAAAQQAGPDTTSPQPQTPQIAAAPGAPNLALPVQAMGNVPNGPSASLHLTEQTPGAAPDINSLAVEIAARSQSGAKQFDIRLDPPALGRVEVRLAIDASGKVQAHMTADQPDTLNLLRKDSGTLTQALRDAGLDVSRDGLNFSLRGQAGHGGQQGHGSSGPQTRRANLIARSVIDSIESASLLSRNGAAADARLDIHV
jgi:flagellar hook-length control protein FliK